MIRKTTLQALILIGISTTACASVPIDTGLEEKSPPVLKQTANHEVLGGFWATRQKPEVIVGVYNGIDEPQPILPSSSCGFLSALEDYRSGREGLTPQDTEGLKEA